MITMHPTTRSRRRNLAKTLPLLAATASIAVIVRGAAIGSSGCSGVASSVSVKVMGA